MALRISCQSPDRDVKRLLQNEHYLEPRTIPKGAYANAPAVETLSVDALWVTDESEPERLIYGMLKALYNPANRPALQAVRQGAHFMELSFGAEAGARAITCGCVALFH